MIKMRDLFRKILIAICALFIVLPCFAETDAEIGDYGMWATENNRQLVTGTMTKELTNFGPENVNVSESFVPIEAKLGLAFMGGMAKIGMALDSSLVRFAIIFMLLAYAFWIAFEGYNLINSGADAKATIKDIVVKGVIISAWIMILDFGIARAFTMIMIPIVSFGTFISTTIWNNITSTAGFSLPDNCAAIKEYAANNISPYLVNVQGADVTKSTLYGLNITTESAAGLLCVPSQMSAFFVTVIKIGWNWVVSSVGVGLFGAVLGLVIVYLGLKSIWKYLFAALGVIADLFLGLLMLPFTAIAETTAKTNYKGVAGGIFNSFLEIFKAENLKTQINRFINATLYFILLSVAIGVSVSLLAYTINPMNGQISSNMNMDGLGGVIVLIMVLLLVCYMADKATDLATKWGGKIDTSVGDTFKKDIEKLWSLFKKYAKVPGLNGADSPNGNGNGDFSSGDGNNSNGGGDDSNNKNLKADIALIGMQKTGKYTLLSVLSPTQMVVANDQYSSRPVRFGFLRINGVRRVLAYLPPLTAGASTSVAYGNRFLKHAEKARLILHIIDANEPDWYANYKDIRDELGYYGNGLTAKQEIVVITKKDAITDAEFNTKLNAFRAAFGSNTIPTIVPVSAQTREGIDDLIDAIKRKF